MVASVATGKIFGGLKSNKRPKTQARPIAIIKTPAEPINSHRFTPIPKNSICKFSLKKSCNTFNLNTPNKRVHQHRYPILIFPSSLTTSCSANWGFALPLASFITCPTRNLTAVSLPLKKSSTAFSLI